MCVLRLKRIFAGLKRPATCILVIAALIVLLLALPILILLLAVDQAATRRRKLAALAATTCAVCGSSLSPDGLDLADVTWRSTLVVQPTMRLRRVVQRLHAICPACGARYEWDGARHRFHLLDPGQSRWSAVDARATRDINDKTGDSCRKQAKA